MSHLFRVFSEGTTGPEKNSRGNTATNRLFVKSSLAAALHLFVAGYCCWGGITGCEKNIVAQAELFFMLPIHLT